MTNHSALTRDGARARFEAAGLSRDKVITTANIQRLRTLINQHMTDSGLILGSFRCRQRGVVKMSRGILYAEIRCKAFYFDDREAISFNTDGFIGFAGWADETNIQPVLSGFVAWVDELAAAELRQRVGPKGLQILQHSLGVDQHGRGRQYRNHFATGPGSVDHNACNSLVELGLMDVQRCHPLNDKMDCFWVTRAGKEYVSKESPPPPRMTRDQRRYQQYLDVADCYTSFGSYLRHMQAQRAGGFHA